MKKKFLAIACTVTAACMAGATLAGCGLKSEKVQNEPGVAKKSLETKTLSSM